MKKEWVVKMGIPSLSAGSGPAAFVLIGGVMVLFNMAVGWYVMAAGGF